MKKAFLTIMVSIILLAGLLIAAPVSAIDISKPFGINTGLAEDTVQLDMRGSVRKLLDTDYTVHDGIQELNIRSKESEYLTQGEIGITLLGVRPFFQYEGLSSNYNTREWGIDTYLFSNKLFGIGGRISHIDHDTHFDREKMWSVGIQGIIK